MRIAVCAPQVPFVRGGAELMADELVDALRARGHEAELVTMPFKWYPGTRVLDQAFLWRLVDLTESDGRPIDRVIATKFPAYCVRHPNKVAWVAAPVPAGLRLRPHRARPVRRVARATARPARAVERLDARRARRGAAGLRDLAERRRPAASASTGIDAEVLPHPPQTLAYRTAELGGLRALGQPARPREADRPADRGGEARAGAADRDRRRGPRPRAARAARLRA